MKTLILHEVNPQMWEAFLSDGHSPPRTIPSAVMRSWKRARALGVDPEGLHHSDQVDEPGALLERKGRLERVLREAEPLLRDMSAQLAEHHFILALADTDGVVLRLSEGGNFQGVAQRTRLVEGAHWSERARGTNAIGTVLAEGAPVIVAGAAHYTRVNHGLVCYASPIRDGFGEIVAVLDATSMLSQADDFVHLAVRSTTLAIEQTLRLQTYPQAGATSLRVIDQILEHCPSPAVLVERPGLIRMANSAARALPGAEMLFNQPASVALGVDWTRLEAHIMRGATLLLPQQPTRLGDQNHRLELEPVFDAQGRLWATLVFLEPAVTAAPSQSPARSAAVDAFDAVGGDDPHLRQTLLRAAELAQTQIPLLITGQDGTGKGLLAEAIHKSSPRAAGPLIFLSAQEVDHQRLTDAVEAARGGTLVLSQLATLLPPAQALLLTFLGSAESLQANVRLICTSEGDLSLAVHKGTFNAELYRQIHGAELHLPPLHQRQDLEAVVQRQMGQIAALELISPCPSLSPEAMVWVKSQRWPDNMRGLKRALHQAILNAHRRPVIGLDELPGDVGGGGGGVSEDVQDGGTLADAEAEALRQALRNSGGNVSRAARSLGVARSTLYRMMKRHGLVGK